MTQSKATRRSNMLARKYVRAGLRNLNTLLKATEKLQKSIQSYRITMPGTVITPKTTAVATAVGILEAVLPAIIEDTNKLINKQKKLLK